MIKSFLRSILSSFGLKIGRIHSTLPIDLIEENTMLAALNRIKSLGINPKTIVDVGAAAGTWTLKASGVWKEAAFLVMEPLEERRNELEELKKELTNPMVVTLAAAGNMEGSVQFHVSGDLDGSAIARDNEPSDNKRIVQLTTIDTQIARNKLAGPFAIKLDTHGFEVPILEGSAQTLKDTALIIVECYGFEIAPASLLFWEMCSYISTLGFRLFDVVDTMRRPDDYAFWQCDAFFIKDSTSVFERKSYRK